MTGRPQSNSLSSAVIAETGEQEPSDRMEDGRVSVRSSLPVSIRIASVVLTFKVILHSFV